MCLTIDPAQEKYLVWDENGEAEVLKVLVLENGRFRSPYKESLYIPEEWKKSFREGVVLEQYEKECKRVDEGLHFFLTHDGAVKEMLEWRSAHSWNPNIKIVIVRMKIRKEDVVAVGIYNAHPSVVALKAFFPQQEVCEEVHHSCV
jgi:hypothetical protein